MKRVIVAFFVAPATMLLLLSGLLYSAASGPSQFRDSLPMLVVVAAYLMAATVVVGVPGVVVFRRRGWRRAWPFALAGFAAGAAVVLLHAMTMSRISIADMPFTLAFGSIGAVTAWVFWLVAARRNPWFMPPPEEAAEAHTARAARWREAGRLAGQGAAKLVGAAQVAVRSEPPVHVNGADKTPG